MDNIELKLKEKYSDIINWTEYREPNYEEINFKEFLKRHFKELDLFHNDSNVKAKIDSHLELLEKHFDKSSLFNRIGSNEVFEFTKLKYYQPEVGISGRQKSNLQLPVFVVKLYNDLILYDGYHRTLIRIVDGKKVIEALYIDLDNIIGYR